MYQDKENRCKFVMTVVQKKKQPKNPDLHLVCHCVLQVRCHTSYHQCLNFLKQTRVSSCGIFTSLSSQAFKLKRRSVSIMQIGSVEYISPCSTADDNGVFF